jgi:hypothetical protein
MVGMPFEARIPHCPLLTRAASASTIVNFNASDRNLPRYPETPWRPRVSRNLPVFEALRAPDF